MHWIAAQMERTRAHFPALQRSAHGRAVAFLDGPAGSQVPQCVIDAVAGYLRDCNANHGGEFDTSRRSDALLEEAHRAVADLLGAPDPAGIIFGANMTTLTLAFSRAIARTWRAGDEVLISQLDHDGNFAPWQLAARDAGVVVRPIAIRASDCTLDMDDLRRQLSPRTRLVAVGAASNFSGTINPVAEIVRCAHAVGAEVFIDAVHYAPHRLMDVAGWGCDYLVCSAYKFFGPHVGVLWGRPDRMEALQPYKLSVAPDSLPGRWMTGTQNHEGIAGVLAAVNYLASLTPTPTPASRREAIVKAMELIAEHEHELARQCLRGLRDIPGLQVFGITDEARLAERVPTFSFRSAKISPQEMARRLGEAGIFVWHGNFYALPLTQALGIEPAGAVRAGFLHYNTAAEVERLVEALRALA